MGHDQYFISRRLKNNKERFLDKDQEFFHEMAIDMEFPHADIPNQKAEKNEEPCT